MPWGEWLILMGIGALFVLLGVGAIIWGRGEEKSYYDSMPASRVDVREFLEHLPFRPEPAALKIGGWIALALGVLLLLAGGAWWLWG